MKYKRIFKTIEIDSHGKGWIADLSPAHCVDPDCYWYFPTKKQAVKFIELVDSGIPAQHAVNIINS